MCMRISDMNVSMHDFQDYVLRVRITVSKCETDRVQKCAVSRVVRAGTYIRNEQYRHN